MSISSILRMHGEFWEVQRNGQHTASFLGLRNTQERRIGFMPDADIREGDVLTGAKCKQTHAITRTDSEVGHGEVVCIYAYYGERLERGGGNTIHIQGNAYGSNFMMDSPGATQNVTFTPDSAANLKDIVKELLGSLDELGLSDPDKESLKEDAEYLKKKLDAGKAEPGLVREFLASIKKKLADAASAAASSQIATQAGRYLELVTSFLSKSFGG